jgi:hypothetical protein
LSQAKETKVQNKIPKKEPTNGPTMKIHKPDHLPEMIAGPRERAGLIEQPSTGRRTVCPRKTAKPIAKGAIGAIPVLLDSLATHMCTTKQRNPVMTISPRRASPEEKPGETELDPRELALAFGIMP